MEKIILVTLLCLFVVSSQRLYPRGPCKPESQLEWFCNQCRCTADGMNYICTRKACPGEEDPTCTPGTRFTRDGCNVCVCPENGNRTVAACTLKACISPEQVQSCTPGEQFSNDGCNTCTCPGNGNRSQAACTLMACVDKKK
ncbi:pacifastin-like protease inhibitor cvp4 [Anabrus simplex]|uniref:pacifastin-like protease inhibitor cvp4 n=1 Tax=Anabrus simplex TaxID=316456 RepID=UPI0035A347B1